MPRERAPARGCGASQWRGPFCDNLHPAPSAAGIAMQTTETPDGQADTSRVVAADRRGPALRRDAAAQQLGSPRVGCTHVDHAETLGGAIESLGQCAYDAVLLDLGLSDSDGVQAVDAQPALSRCRHHRADRPRRGGARRRGDGERRAGHAGQGQLRRRRCRARFTTRSSASAWKAACGRAPRNIARCSRTTRFRSGSTTATRCVSSPSTKRPCASTATRATNFSR